MTMVVADSLSGPGSQEALAVLLLTVMIMEGVPLGVGLAIGGYGLGRLFRRPS